jgi:hypothetical protein
VLFEKRFWSGIADGSITLTFRRWKRPQVVAGRRYRTPGGIVEVTAVDTVEPAVITDREARAAGYGDAAELAADLRDAPDLACTRVAFHVVDEPDPRAVLAADDRLDAAARAEIDRRLARLDAASTAGPWTLATLRAIAARPGSVRPTSPPNSDGRRMRSSSTCASSRRSG